MVINGKEIARDISERLKKQPVPKKIFAGVLVGQDPASVSFLKIKGRVAKELNVDFRLYAFEPDIKNDALRKEILKLSLSKAVGGVVVQLPLPEYLNRHYVLNVIPREKDVDVLGERALGAFYADRNLVLPPAAATVKEIIERTGFSLPNARVAVVGLGLLVGRPVANWLTGKAKEIYLFDRASELEDLKSADLVITGTGSAGVVKPRMLKAGAGVIDFGCFFDEAGKVCGDFDATETEDADLKFYTPTPGGTGPILVAKLFENFFTLNESAHGQKAQSDR